MTTYEITYRYKTGRLKALFSNLILADSEDEAIAILKNNVTKKSPIKLVSVTKI